MISRLKSLSLIGLEGHIVDIETVIHRGLPSFTIVGLGDASIQESRERVRAALKQSGFEFPRGKIALNLAPANLRKQGARFDLAIALGILEAHRQITIPKIYQEALLLGELSFNGDLRPVIGILPSVHAASLQGFKTIILPKQNSAEAALIEGVNILGVENLKELCEFFSTGNGIEKQHFEPFLAPVETNVPPYDFQYIKGNSLAKRGLEIAAAGGHNLLMNGPPGSGKTMLARAYSTILPDLTFDESLDITKVHSIAGILDPSEPVLRKRPFRAVHHTASGVAIVGGGNPPRPGEISLAHRGVLFLDEFAEFSAKTLEVLRQPLEDGEIRISRAAGSVSYPAQFSLVAAMNPCPCGFYQDTKKDCTCAPFAVQRYRQKISGPILDRIDVHLNVPRVEVADLTKEILSENSARVRARVQAARKFQLNRFKKQNVICNADMNSAQVQKFCALDEAGQTLLNQVVEKMQLSGRAYYRTLKLARTIADLEASDYIKSHHIAEAVQYRSVTP
ncbi:YifB family Mg chelatase-like AAA ATPase [bacterium]|nr:YifB family Mg chelatase-like AAA ATPase [bacterium]NCQ55277.1 YifB family Mg chelatase-like AAA ATPase [Candidatus Parcubacteria bacterium]NCS67210.1 YifB family Mg chelatase-like AAA ATPase [Candidatus Peregrinibacteria bacterium]NCS96465.1 YifB family Mg chelatase-like AAA ATPase [bacterium]